MALLGWSLILASVVYLAIRKPPLIETLVALFRGSPTIQQPPSTRSPSAAGTERIETDEDHLSAQGSSSGAAVAATGQDSSPSVRRRVQTDRGPIPSITLAPETEAAGDIATQVEKESATEHQPIITEPPLFTIASPQTTPKASAVPAPAPDRDSAIGSIPSFSLSPSAATPTMAQPTLSLPSPPLGPTPTPTQPPKMPSMAPPPRPPRLNPVANSAATSSLAPPARPSPLPNRSYDRQPGTSTLAPPPTHSAKPAKPSKKVTLKPGHSPLDWARLANHPAADLRGLGPDAPYLRVTPSALRKMTGRKGKDAWTALGGRVYNMTPYLPFHPGGEPELLRAAGRDGTKLFGEIHPWVNYETMMSSCLIGLLVDEGDVAGGGDMDEMD
ncbi:hypothetical protein F4808DRAFT_400087 [Astrocystis sublimbata]|nr:hypothetical protein F4808DRAFT_400087 [Astrocystis sublimbata]